MKCWMRTCRICPVSTKLIWTLWRHGPTSDYSLHFPGLLTPLSKINKISLTYQDNRWESVCIWAKLCQFKIVLSPTLSGVGGVRGFSFKPKPISNTTPYSWRSSDKGRNVVVGQKRGKTRKTEKRKEKCEHVWCCSQKCICAVCMFICVCVLRVWMHAVWLCRGA